MVMVVTQDIFLNKGAGDCQFFSGNLGSKWNSLDHSEIVYLTFEKMTPPLIPWYIISPIFPTV